MGEHITIEVDIGNNADFKDYSNEIESVADHILTLRDNLEAKMSREHKEWNENDEGSN